MFDKIFFIIIYGFVLYVAFVFWGDPSLFFL